MSILTKVVTTIFGKKSDKDLKKINPYINEINQQYDSLNALSDSQIKEKFESIRLNKDKNAVFSCGSGVTASVLALAYSLINAKYMPTIYDGSWAEYGKN